MKTKFIALFALVAVVFAGCKDEKSAETQEVKAAPIGKTFKVTLKVIVKNDDDAALFVAEDGTTDFKSEPIWQGIKGSPTEQDITYSLPDGVFPTGLRIDMGLKPQEGMALKSVTLAYMGKTRTIAGAELGNFFRADDTKCSFDPATGEIKAVTVNGKREIPSLYPHDALKAEIEKLAQ